MGKRKVIVKQSVANSIAEIAWFIESKGMVSTAEKFTDSIYDYLIKLSDSRVKYRKCFEPKRAALGFKCIAYKSKYTIVFIESETELVICEFVLSKRINW